MEIVKCAKWDSECAPEALVIITDYTNVDRNDIADICGIWTALTPMTDKHPKGQSDCWPNQHGCVWHERRLVSQPTSFSTYGRQLHTEPFASTNIWTFCQWFLLSNCPWQRLRRAISIRILNKTVSWFRFFYSPVFQYRVRPQKRSAGQHFRSEPVLQSLMALALIRVVRKYSNLYSKKSWAKTSKMNPVLTLLFNLHRKFRAQVNFGSLFDGLPHSLLLSAKFWQKNWSGVQCTIAQPYGLSRIMKQHLKWWLQSVFGSPVCLT